MTFPYDLQHVPGLGLTGLPTDVILLTMIFLSKSLRWFPSRKGKALELRMFVDTHVTHKILPCLIPTDISELPKDSSPPPNDRQWLILDLTWELT